MPGTPAVRLTWHGFPRRFPSDSGCRKYTLTNTSHGSGKDGPFEGDDFLD